MTFSLNDCYWIIVSIYHLNCNKRKRKSCNRVSLTSLKWNYHLVFIVLLLWSKTDLDPVSFFDWPNFDSDSNKNNNRLNALCQPLLYCLIMRKIFDALQFDSHVNVTVMRVDEQYRYRNICSHDISNIAHAAYTKKVLAFPILTLS